MPGAFAFVIQRVRLGMKEHGALIDLHQCPWFVG
jgi:hypothetical protein